MKKMDNKVPQDAMRKIKKVFISCMIGVLLITNAVPVFAYSEGVDNKSENPTFHQFAGNSELEFQKAQKQLQIEKFIDSSNGHIDWYIHFNKIKDKGYWGTTYVHVYLPTGVQVKNEIRVQTDNKDSNSLMIDSFKPQREKKESYNYEQGKDNIFQEKWSASLGKTIVDGAGDYSLSTANSWKDKGLFSKVLIQTTDMWNIDLVWHIEADPEPGTDPEKVPLIAGVTDNHKHIRFIIDGPFDSDEDGLTDKEEVKKYHTNPNDPDSDDDGYIDGKEVLFGAKENMQTDSNKFPGIRTVYDVSWQTDESGKSKVQPNRPNDLGFEYTNSDKNTIIYKYAINDGEPIQSEELLKLLKAGPKVSLTAEQAKVVRHLTGDEKKKTEANNLEKYDENAFDKLGKGKEYFQMPDKEKTNFIRRYLEKQLIDVLDVVGTDGNAGKNYPAKTTEFKGLAPTNTVTIQAGKNNGAGEVKLTGEKFVNVEPKKWQIYAGNVSVSFWSSSNPKYTEETDDVVNLWLVGVDVTKPVVNKSETEANFTKKSLKLAETKDVFKTDKIVVTDNYSEAGKITKSFKFFATDEPKTTVEIEKLQVGKSYRVEVVAIDEAKNERVLDLGTFEIEADTNVKPAEPVAEAIISKEGTTVTVKVPSTDVIEIAIKKGDGQPITLKYGDGVWENGYTPVKTDEVGNLVVRIESNDEQITVINKNEKDMTSEINIIPKNISEVDKIRLEQTVDSTNAPELKHVLSVTSTKLLKELKLMKQEPNGEWKEVRKKQPEVQNNFFEIKNIEDGTMVKIVGVNGEGFLRTSNEIKVDKKGPDEIATIVDDVKEGAQKLTVNLPADLTDIGFMKVNFKSNKEESILVPVDSSKVQDNKFVVDIPQIIDMKVGDDIQVQLVDKLGNAGAESRAVNVKPADITENSVKATDLKQNGENITAVVKDVEEDTPVYVTDAKGQYLTNDGTLVKDIPSDPLERAKLISGVAKQGKIEINLNESKVQEKIKELVQVDGIKLQVREHRKNPTDSNVFKDIDFTKPKSTPSGTAFIDEDKITVNKPSDDVTEITVEKQGSNKPMTLVKKDGDKWELKDKPSVALGTDQEGNILVPVEKINDNDEFIVDYKNDRGMATTSTVEAKASEITADKPKVVQDKNKVVLTPGANNDKVEVQYKAKDSNSHTTITIEKSSTGTWSLEGENPNNIQITNEGEITIPKSLLEKGKPITVYSHVKNSSEHENININNDESSTEQSKKPTDVKQGVNNLGKTVVTGKATLGAKVELKTPDGKVIGETTADPVSGDFEIIVPENTQGEAKVYVTENGKPESDPETVNITKAVEPKEDTDKKANVKQPTSKVVVENPNNLTYREKDLVKAAVKDANPKIDSNSIKVDDKGNVFVNENGVDKLVLTPSQTIEERIHDNSETHDRERDRNDYISTINWRYIKAPTIETKQTKIEAKEEKTTQTTKTELKIKIGQDTLKTKTGDKTKEIKMDTKAIIKDGRTMLPIRYVAESLGYKVEWKEATRTVVLTNKNTTIEIPVDTNKIIINGQEIESDVKPIIENGRTMLPIANIARALGLKDGQDIKWDETNQEVTIKKEITN